MADETPEVSREIVEEFWHRCWQVAAVSHVVLPRSFYRFTLTNCWKCNKEILVFDWPEGCDLEKPKPRTIRYRRSKMAGGEYWGNVCAYCGILQGDFFLHSEPEGPFFGFSCGENIPEIWQADMRKLADLWKHPYF